MATATMTKSYKVVPLKPEFAGIIARLVNAGGGTETVKKNVIKVAALVSKKTGKKVFKARIDKTMYGILVSKASDGLSVQLVQVDQKAPYLPIKE